MLNEEFPLSLPVINYGASVRARRALQYPQKSLNHFAQRNLFKKLILYPHPSPTRPSCSCWKSSNALPNATLLLKQAKSACRPQLFHEAQEDRRLQSVPVGCAKDLRPRQFQTSGFSPCLAPLLPALVSLRIFAGSSAVFTHARLQ
ncbi:hypothetical protein EVAR_23022_1 [Eumeta japonica]|uniref:Uncharacterized protein n=1 Tax=Eumeta variegata TaxID=151549 RepID=A0A4C1URB0_EUMVA|nr:hypothetical protein EVAR_23022_1 [Eumeta japonica]